MYPCISRYTFLIALLLFSACSEEEALLRSPEFRTPVVTGLHLKDNLGRPFGIWKYPDSRNSGYISSCQYIAIFGVAPIPANHQVSIRIPSNCNLPVNVWVTPARLADDLHGDVISFGNTQLLKAGGLAIKTLAKEQLGISHIEWDGTDDNGHPVPSGFYRIYCKTGDLLLWEDILLYINQTDYIPFDLLKSIFKN